MYKVKINQSQVFDIENNSTNDWDILPLENGHFHILKKNKSYRAVLLSADPTTKSFVFDINGKHYEAEVKDKYDLLMQELGLDKKNVKKINQIKAPMPGLVLAIQITVGQKIQKGDSILILEAMKMENVLKAPADAVIKAILVTKGQAVDKNQLLIELE